jgi:hypothetical protein
VAENYSKHGADQPAHDKSKTDGRDSLIAANKSLWVGRAQFGDISIKRPNAQNHSDDTSDNAKDTPEPFLSSG